MEEFLERIDINTSIKDIAQKICLKCNIEGYVSSQIVEVGYEDFNFIIKTENKKYFVKIFHKGRTSQDCKSYLDRIILSNKLDINAPKVLFNNTLEIDNNKLQFVVFEYINGKSFLDLDEIPNEIEIKEIIRQMANIHKAELESDFIYDTWTITNFVNEFNSKGKCLEEEYYIRFKKLTEKMKKVDLSRLPHSFVHGDIISSNVIKDINNKLWIIDFAVSNYLPRIIDLVVTGVNLCLDPNSKDNTINNFRFIISEYEKYSKLTDYEKQVIPIFYEIGNAMGILQINALKQNGAFSKEDEYWLRISEKGLNYSNEQFWNKIIS